MPRKARKESGTGVYHVMLRGINRQDSFEDAEDYMRMLRCMQQMLEQYDDQGNRLPPLCTFYAYCLMSNHVHLLLRVNQEDIGSTIKDQGKPDHQSPLGLLRERCQGPSLGRNQFLSAASLGESRAQKSADHHRSLEGGWSIAPY